MRGILKRHTRDNARENRKEGELIGAKEVQPWPCGYEYASVALI